MIHRGEQLPALVPQGQRERGTGRVRRRKPVIFSPSCITVLPVRVPCCAHPLRSDAGEGMQGMPQRFAHHVEAVQGPHRREDMGGVRPLPTPRLDELAIAAPREQGLEEQRLRRPSDQAGAKFTEDRAIKSRIRQLPAEDVFPIETTAHGVGRLAIGEAFGTWQERDQCQPPGGPRGLSVRGEECQPNLLSKEPIPCIGHA